MTNKTVTNAQAKPEPSEDGNWNHTMFGPNVSLEKEQVIAVEHMEWFQYHWYNGCGGAPEGHIVHQKFDAMRKAIRAWVKEAKKWEAQYYDQD